MRSRRRRHRKNNIRAHGRSIRHETVFVPSPCNDEHNADKAQSLCGKDDVQTAAYKTPRKDSNGFSLKKIFGNILGKSDNDDLIIIVLIVIIFLSRHRSEDDCDGQDGDSKEFSVMDFMSKASDILKKFNDNDILLIALLYILL